ncbi:hypothetical protein Bca4012_009789 [Brassica carinata]
MVYSMRNPPMHFEEFVRSHYFVRALDIVKACNPYKFGAPVASIVKGGVQDIIHLRIVTQDFYLRGRVQEDQPKNMYSASDGQDEVAVAYSVKLSNNAFVTSLNLREQQFITTTCLHSVLHLPPSLGILSQGGEKTCVRSSFCKTTGNLEILWKVLHENKHPVKSSKDDSPTLPRMVASTSSDESGVAHFIHLSNNAFVSNLNFSEQYLIFSTCLHSDLHLPPSSGILSQGGGKTWVRSSFCKTSGNLEILWKVLHENKHPVKSSKDDSPTLPRMIASTSSGRSEVTLDKLVLGKKKQDVAGRLLRMWEAKNILNGSLISLDFLLLDSKDALIQGSIYHRRIHRFKDLLKEGSIYLLSTNLHLIDVVGQVLKIQGSHLEDSTSTQKIVLLLLLDDNSTVRVTLWDNQASDFRQQYQHTGNDCFVVVFTCLNPKMFAGKLHLNSSGSTKIFIDKNLEAVQAFINRCSSKIVEEDTNKLHVEMWTIEKILQYVSSGADEEKEVVCRAKVIDISNHNGWKYLACGSCSHKLGRSDTSLICNNCSQKTIIGVARFRIELEVESGDRTTTFVLFNQDAKKITNTTAEELTVLEEKEEEISQGNQKVPKCLLDIVGKTMDFQVKIAEYNFTASFQTFTVTRITKANSIIQAKDDAITTKDKTFKQTEAEMYGNIKKEDGEVRPTFQILGSNCQRRKRNRRCREASFG